MSGYAVAHNDKGYMPDGSTPISGEHVQTHNERTELAEIAWLQTGPDKVFLYVRVEPRDPNKLGSRLMDGSRSTANGDKIAISTWPGTNVATHAYIGRSVPVGGIAGRWATKRSVDCRIFGVRYTGWFYESAGDYCRLKRAKQQ